MISAHDTGDMLSTRRGELANVRPTALIAFLLPPSIHLLTHTSVEIH